MNFTALAIVCSITAVIVGDWMAGVALMVLVLAWKYLPKKDTPPILAMAFTYQWLQATAGIYYMGLTGRWLPALDAPSHRKMVLLALGCVVSMFIGVTVGDYILDHFWPRKRATENSGVSMTVLAVAYVVMTAAQGIVFRFAWTVAGLTSGLLALLGLRLAAAFLILRRLLTPRKRWVPFAALLTFEVLLGFTGYFADFREIEVLAIVAVLETVRRLGARQWLTLGALIAVLVVSAIVWTSAKAEIRSRWDTDAAMQTDTGRLETVLNLSADLFDWDTLLDNTDNLVQRQWAIYYPSFALDRVPEVQPHENGAILKAAIVHVLTPRLLYPNKPEALNDSYMVRKYTGVFVAGSESNTSIAFGYAIESYVDFGVPVMFLPPFVFGIVMGLAYRTLLILLRNQDIAVPLVCLVMWMSLYLFERSWLRMLGISLTFLGYVGAAGVLIDRLVTAVNKHRQIRLAVPGGARAPRLGGPARPPLAPAATAHRGPGA